MVAGRVRVTGEVLLTPLDLCQFKDAPGERLLNVENFQNLAPLVGLTVSDNGPGIPPEVLPKIFHPYFTTKAGGSGLGLSICKRIVFNHHGRIWAESPGIGKGTTIRFTLNEQPG